MSNFVDSLIRTYAPIIIGAVVSWLAVRGFEIDPETSAAAVIALTGALQAAYYGLARLLESRWPNAGLLLFRRSTPDYEG